MLNPKLTEVYGNESEWFFTELISSIGDDLATMCTVPEDGYSIYYDDMSAPNIVRVYCEDRDLYWKVCSECMRICCDI